jgi:hypothetical protein
MMPPPPTDKSLLVLFFRKELLPFTVFLPAFVSDRPSEKNVASILGFTNVLPRRILNDWNAARSANLDGQVDAP